MSGPWVRQIEREVAAPFIEEWHYSHQVPTGRNLFFGWYLENELYAVANYGIGVNCHQAKYLSEHTQYNVTPRKLLELKHLCRMEPKRENLPLTQFLAACHRLLKESGINFIVSFSDPEYGHTGGIYRAANFRHLGQTNPERHLIDESGQQVHRRVARHYATRYTLSQASIRRLLGLTIRKALPKDRWFLVLDKFAEVV